MSIADREMTISKNNATIAENMEKVRFAAYIEGTQDGQEAGFNSGYETGLELGYGQGVSSMWDIIQQGGTRTNCDYMFANWGLSGLLKPPYPIIAKQAGWMFGNCTEITMIEDVTLHESVKYCHQMYYRCLKFKGHTDGNGNLNEEHIFGGPNVISYNSAFTACNAIRKIIVDISGVGTYTNGLNNTFRECYSLEELKLIGKVCQSLYLGHSSKLNFDSIFGVMEALETDSEKTTASPVVTFAKECKQTVFDNYLPGEFLTEDEAWKAFWSYHIGSSTHWTIAIKE